MKCFHCGAEHCRCAQCGAVLKNPISVAGGKKGGLARVKKGFAVKSVRDKAEITRRTNNARIDHTG